MKAINKKIILFVISFCVFSLNMRADWQIVGDAVLKGTQAVLTQSSDNSQQFVYIGKLTNQHFKITDGIKSYVHDCGDSDPLEQSITLREENDSDESGLRIRYVGLQDHFKVTLTVTQNEKTVTAERIAPPKHVYIIGGPFSYHAYHWALEDAVELSKDADDPFVFYYRGELRYNSMDPEGGSIKILLGRDWTDNYHPDVSGDFPLSQASKMRLNGEDNKWTIPSDRSRDGHYVIKINTLEMTIEVEEFVRDIDVDDSPRSIFIVGDAIPCGWSHSSPMFMEKIKSGVYQWYGSVSEGEFKFLRRRGGWDECFVATTGEERVIFDSQHTIVYEDVNGPRNDHKFVIPEAGTYYFTVNLNTMKMVVSDSPTGLESRMDTDNGISFYSNNGKLFIESGSEESLQAVVYGIDGRMITTKTFIASTEIVLAKGFYLVVLNDEEGERVTAIKTLIY